MPSGSCYNRKSAASYEIHLEVYVPISYQEVSIVYWYKKFGLELATTKTMWWNMFGARQAVHRMCHHRGKKQRYRCCCSSPNCLCKEQRIIIMQWYTCHMQMDDIVMPYDDVDPININQSFPINIYIILFPFPYEWLSIVAHNNYDPFTIFSDWCDIVCQTGTIVNIRSIL